MNETTKIISRKALSKIQEAITLLETIEGESTELDEVAEALGFAFADLEYEINNN